MKSKVRAETLLLIGAGLTIWAVFLFFQNTYFGAFFYGQPTPVWAAWVGNLPVYSFNLIDTIAVALIILGIIVEFSGRGHGRSLHSSSKGSAAFGAIFVLLAFVIVGAVLFMLFHITFSDLINAARGFFLPSN